VDKGGDGPWLYVLGTVLMILESLFLFLVVLAPIH
jgi:hypothetical protein